MANKYRKPYVEYHDGTDVGADDALLSPESRAVVAQGKAVWQKGYETGDQAMMDQGHAMAEGERAKAGYSGGANGGAYNPFADEGGAGEKGVHASGVHMTSPTWSDPYRAERDSAISQLQSRKPFSYDPEIDPAYQQYKEQYTREGKRAMDDTLAKVSARTGGLASSYATSAAGQANNYYMQQLADKVPELRQLAYQMYQDEGDRLRADAQMYGSLSANDANIWQGTTLQPFQSDRDYALDVDNTLYDRGVTERQMGLQQAEFDRQGDWHREEREDVAYERQKESASLKAESGDFSGYQSLYALTDEQTQALRDIWQKESSYQDRVRAVEEAVQQFQTAGDARGMEALGWDTREALRQLALETQAKELDVDLARKQVANYGRSGGRSGGGYQPTDQAQRSILETMRSLGSDEAAKEYLMGLGLSQWEYNNYLAMYEEGKPKDTDPLPQSLQRSMAYYNAPKALVGLGSAETQKANWGANIADQIEAGVKNHTISPERAKKLLEQMGY